MHYLRNFQSLACELFACQQKRAQMPQVSLCSMSIHLFVNRNKYILPHNCFLSLHFVEERCDEGTIRLANQETYTGYINSTEYVEVTSGVLEVCFNGTYVQMCNSSRVDPALADTVCYSLGYDGQLMELNTFIH